MTFAFQTASVAMREPGSCDQLTTDTDRIPDPYEIVSVREEYTGIGYLLREIERAGGLYTIDLLNRSGQVISRVVYPQKPLIPDRPVNATRRPRTA